MGIDRNLPGVPASPSGVLILSNPSQEALAPAR
jgi:hypothetical protein